MSVTQRAHASPVGVEESLWIHLYLTEFSRWLPNSARAAAEADVLRQIDAALAKQPNRKEAAILATLKQLGAPQRLALQYGGGRSLIGPILYPTFLRVLQIVLAISLAASLFGIFAALGWQQAPPSIGGVISGTLGSLFAAAGFVVLIFALVERFASINAQDLDKDWNPTSLRAAQGEDSIRVGETIFEIVINIAALVFLIFYWDRVGGFFVLGQGWVSTPVLSEAFGRFVPWLALWWGANTLLAIIVLARGYWQPITRIAKIVIEVGALAVLAAALMGGPLTVYPALEIGVQIALAITMVVIVFEIGKQILRLVRNTGHNSRTGIPEAQ